MPSWVLLKIRVLHAHDSDQLIHESRPASFMVPIGLVRCKFRNVEQVRFPGVKRPAGVHQKTEIEVSSHTPLTQILHSLSLCRTIHLLNTTLIQVWVLHFRQVVYEYFQIAKPDTGGVSDGWPFKLYTHGSSKKKVAERKEKQVAELKGKQEQGQNLWDALVLLHDRNEEMKHSNGRGRQFSVSFCSMKEKISFWTNPELF